MRASSGDAPVLLGERGQSCRNTGRGEVAGYHGRSVAELLAELVSDRRRRAKNGAMAMAHVWVNRCNRHSSEQVLTTKRAARCAVLPAFVGGLFSAITSLVC